MLLLKGIFGGFLKITSEKKPQKILRDFYTEQMDAEGLGSRLLLTPPPPPRQLPEKP